MKKIGEAMKKLKAENLSLHGELVLENTAYARAWMDIIRHQREKKEAVKVKEGVVRLFVAERAKRKNSSVRKQVKKNVSAVTMKAGEQSGGLAVSLEQTEMEVEGLRIEKEASI